MTDTNTSTGGNTAEISPVVSGSPEEVAEGVFVIPDGRVPLVPNVGVIVGDRAALVVEAGLGPRSGTVVLEAARELADDRPLFLTLTHFHPEHGFGAQAFVEAATIVYNRGQHEEFREKAAVYLEQFRGFGGEIEKQLEGVEFVDPHVVYDGAADLDLGGKIVQLRNRGPAHSRGDQTVFLPDERVLFTGDLVENRFFPIFSPFDADVDGSRWIGVLEDLRQLDPRSLFRATANSAIPASSNLPATTSSSFGTRPSASPARATTPTRSPRSSSRGCAPCTPTGKTPCLSHPASEAS